MTGDNRIRLDETPVDFDRVDDTGQRHDDYPSSDKKARFDQIRSYLIGLLSNQSSEEEPFEKRIGTPWYSKKENNLKIYNGESFVDISNHIDVVTDENKVTIQAAIDSIMAMLEFVGPRLVWSGFFSSDEINNIPIPEDYHGYALMSGMKPFVYVDGKLLDPRKTVIRSGDPTYINIVGGIDVKPQQTYTVILQKVTDIKQNEIVAEG